MLRIVLDTTPMQVGSDADTPIRMKLTDTAVARAKRRFGVERKEELAKALGFSRMTFYRLLGGTHDIRLSKAVEVAKELGLPLDRTFERV